MSSALPGGDASWEEVEAALLASERPITEALIAHLKAHSAITSPSLYAMGIARRALALSAGFKLMVEHRNSLCALPIVRMQLDTALRLYAGFFVGDHHDFADRVIKGDQINRMKSADGDKLTDKYLVKRVAKRNPWIPTVYEHASGHVHFSNRHISAAFNEHDGNGNFKMLIGPNDGNREPKDFHEPARCMTHLNLIIGVALADWLETKCTVPIGQH